MEDKSAEVASSALLYADTDRRIIAVDLDDVLCQTNQAVADWHNGRYGTEMVLDDFHYYHYWKNPYWGTPDETHEKVKEFYADWLMAPEVVPGALEGVQEIQRLGYELVIVTARHFEEESKTRLWLKTHFPDVFTDVICTGQFMKDEDGKESFGKRCKSEVCHKIGAQLLIDDSVENALACAGANPSVSVLLFGDYQWNKRESKVDSPEDHLGYDDRLKAEGGHEWWKEDLVDGKLPRSVNRVKNWKEVVSWAKENLAMTSESSLPSDSA
ncbi:hypothetical protein SCHPADRAFT_898105 [Schizopora paradoxa]|uniref:HAD-like protein n=1 Tax=Schizopora paradoxa TaxID=27342 RepID=A0A0H2S750_9AGAM|nr:hypothetical protein SCHPADRAFT_898105 [Schizopora paradoxa]